MLKATQVIVLVSCVDCTFTTI